MKCFGGYDPDANPDAERFYINPLADLTIYGHTIDGWLREHEPGDLEPTRQLRIHGREFACWHSLWCPSGELGSNAVENLRAISYKQFKEAQEAGWPFNAELATTTPAVTIAYLDRETGDWSKIYESTEGRPSE